MIKKFEDFITESKRSDYSENPSVYCGTYGKYANGSIEGEWVDITDFDTYEEFMQHCHDLHGDENSAELMFQDFTGFPECWYSENGMDEETFDKIKEFAELDDNRKEAYEAYLSICDKNKDSVDDFEEAYQGYYDDPTDFAAELFQETQNIPENLINYIDWDAVWRDLHLGDGYEDVNGHIFLML